MNWNENDLAVINWIQEIKSCTVASAKQIYRKQVAKLADPEVDGRHEIVWGQISRSAKSGEAGEPKIRREERMAEKTKKKKAKKAAAAEPRPVVELAEISREVILTPAGEEYKHVYTTNLFGRKHAVLYAVVNYDVDNPESYRFNPVHVSDQRLDSLKKFSKEKELPFAVCVNVWVKNKLEQGYAIPGDVFAKFSNKMSRERKSLSLSAEARLAYRNDGWDGCRFVVADPEEAAA